MDAPLNFRFLGNIESESALSLASILKSLPEHSTLTEMRLQIPPMDQLLTTQSLTASDKSLHACFLGLQFMWPVWTKSEIRWIRALVQGA